LRCPPGLFVEQQCERFEALKATERPKKAGRPVKDDPLAFGYWSYRLDFGDAFAFPVLVGSRLRVFSFSAFSASLRKAFTLCCVDG